MTEIDHLQFSILSSETIKKISVAEIVTHDVFDKQIPKHGGLSDLRLGTIDRQFKCQTCKHDAIGCPGHFGHINLAFPVYHICFIKHILKVLQTICVHCKKCKVNVNKKMSRGAKQYKYIYDLAKSKNKCIHCNEIQPKIMLDKYEFIFETDSKQKVSAKDVLDILSEISDSTCTLLGLNPYHSHPKFCIMDCILVPPPHVRPSISMDASLRSQDDLTHKLCEIVKTNNILLKQINSNAPQEQISPLIDLLQYHVTTYIDNGIPGINQATQRTGRPLKAICQRLKSKEGRVRGNLMGKRVNFSARTVITAEPNIDLDELGIPHAIAKTLTFPERVTNFNISHLQSFVNNGPNSPLGKTGANIVHQGNLQKDLRFVSNITLNIGDVVDRHLKDGDYVIFNRQPSLHKMSMMGHKIKVMPHSTFRMNVCATTPYNADYDGDEMNVHAPQNLQTVAEIKEIMSVAQNMVSPQSNKPVIGIIQDTLLGCHKISLLNTFIPKSIVHDIFFKLNLPIPIPSIIKPTPLWTGKQIIASLLPNDFNFQRKSNMFGEKSSHYNDDSFVNIKNGYICSGNLDKRSLGAGELGIIHLLWLEYGPEAAKNFVSHIQYAINHWLCNYGFSIGAPDIFINNDAASEVLNSIETAKNQVNQMINVCKNNPLLNISQYENKINQVLNNAMSQAGLIVKNNISLKNNINSTVTGGSKGSMFNISQIMGCVGQQNVNGKRIDIGYTHRVLPHFAQHDVSPDAKGFVEHSYKTGLEPHEFFFHAMGGREGIIDTAVKSITGDTPIIIMTNNKTEKINIGKLINNYMHSHKENITYCDKTHANMEILDVEHHNIYIPTTSNTGVSSWGKITKMTRHDPSKYIYTFKTKLGRSVKVVESKTLLVWNNESNEFIPTHSENVKIGDFVPVISNLETHTIISSINLKQYFPMEKYIFGSEYKKALNGLDFTLPYKNINSVLRNEKSKSVPIQDGCIYPFGAKRASIYLQENFELNETNGFFIGLYIAEGHSCIKTGKVCVSNINPLILQKVEDYFNKMNISHKTYTKKNTTHHSKTIQGYSTLFATFLQAFVGHRAENKHIPHEIFNAPQKFIIALLDGYFSGDGHVSSNSIECSSASKDLIEDITFLLSRLGIMSKIRCSVIKNYSNSYRLDIRSNMAVKFCNIISLTHPDKNYKQNDIINSSSINKFQHRTSYLNDIVFDTIDSIEICLSNTEKVYDLTIPSTLNFSLANGLTIYDTSETGYIQRRLIKAMEDLQVDYDHSVRNSSGDIISFVYGDDGLDASYLVTDFININENNFNTFFNSNSPIEEINILRDILETYSKSNFPVRSPFSIERLISKLPKVKEQDLTQDYIFQQVKQLCSSCALPIKNKTISNLSSFAIHHLIYVKLNSSYIIKTLSKSNFIILCNQILKFYKRSICQKGESIGTLAAQSIGENVTQLTLNTFHSAGYSAKNVTLGVPRFRELINVAKNIKSPTMTIFVKDTNTDNIDNIAASLEYLQMFDIILNYEIIDINIDNYTTFMSFPEINYSIEEYNPEGIRLHINKNLISNKHITNLDISLSIMQEYENIHTISFPEYIDILFESNENIHHTYLKNFTNKLKSLQINGILGISKVYVENDKSVLETDGSSLSQILQNKQFDFSKCITNDISEVLEILGIEAARTILYQEIKKVLEFDGTYINSRHFTTLVDTMTNKGSLMSITRHGINRSDNGPLMKCSFEETVDVLSDAAMFSEPDFLKGVTENITVGKLANIGTGSFDVFYNSSFINNQSYSPYKPSSDLCYEKSYLSDNISESNISESDEESEEEDDNYEEYENLSEISDYSESNESDFEFEESYVNE